MPNIAAARVLGRRSSDLEIGLVLAVAAAGLLWFALERTGTTQATSNVALLATSIAGSVACFLRAGRSTGGTQRVWLCFGASLACWGLGQLVWTYYEEVLHDDPYPSPADIGYLAAVPFSIAGLLLLPSDRGARHGRTRALLDGMVIAASLLFVSWVVVLRRGFETGGGWSWEHVIALAYPIGDVIVITVAVSALARSWGGARLPRVTLLMVLAASVSLAVADSGFYYFETLEESYVSGHPIDIAWFLGFALILLAARRPPSPVDADDDQAVPRRAAIAMPYVAVVLAIVTATATRVADGALGDPALVMLLVVMVLLIARQYVAVLENSALARTLEDRVRARTAELRSNEERFRSLVQHSSDVVSILGPDGTIRYQSESLEKVFGYEPEPLVGTSFCDLVRPEHRERLADIFHDVSSRPGVERSAEFEFLHATGSWRRCESTVTNLLHVPSVAGLVLNTSDISERKSLEDQLVHEAFHDPLTSLANRALFHDRLGQALVRGHRHPHQVAVLFCDLDGFKAVNDGYGHANGDRLLAEVAERLRACVRPGDTVARLGGDEFGILLGDTAGESEAFAVAERIREALRKPIVILGRDVFVSASVGIAASDDEGDTPDSLLSDADLAMYRAKARGVGGYERFNVAMRPTSDAVDLGNDLHQALPRGELVVHYQPVYALRGGGVAGMEALVRWQHPQRGLLAADHFVPIAERSRLILDLGRWVLGEACRQTAQLKRQGYLAPDAFVAVNVSGRHVHDPSLVDDVERALESSGLDPRTLLLEMTESVLIEHSEETLATLGALKRLGARLAIDDFGTGYSSLSYVHRLPVDVLKIDQSFLEQVGDDGRTGLAEWIVRIGHALGLVTVAEGIERAGQLDSLRTTHCDLGQGFLLCRPLAIDALRHHLGAAAVPEGVLGA